MAKTKDEAWLITSYPLLNNNMDDESGLEDQDQEIAIQLQLRLEEEVSLTDKEIVINKK